MSEPIRRSVRVRCSIERAFELFSSDIDRWWPASHKKSGARMCLEMKTGGRFFQRLESGEELELGTVLRWEPPHRLTYTWLPGSLAKPTEVDVLFTSDGAETLVEVTHSEGRSELGPEWPKRAEIFERAWSEVLSAFQRAIP